MQKSQQTKAIGEIRIYDLQNCINCKNESLPEDLLELQDPLILQMISGLTVIAN
jgi:hypothetical protein